MGEDSEARWLIELRLNSLHLRPDGKPPDQGRRSGTTANWYRYLGRLGYFYDSDTGDFHVRARRYPGVGAVSSPTDFINYKYCDNSIINYLEGFG